MSKFIPMPWDERTEPWTGREVLVAMRLQREGLNFAEIADRLVEAGYPARDETAVQGKLKEATRS